MIKTEPSKYVSLDVDGADQSKFALPYFITSTKDQRGHGLSIHLVGVVIHAPVSVLRLFAMTDNDATDYNHIGESVHCLVNDLSRTGNIPTKFFVQLETLQVKRRTDTLWHAWIVCFAIMYLIMLMLVSFLLATSRAIQTRTTVLCLVAYVCMKPIND